MVFSGKIDPRKKAYILFLSREKNLSIREIVKKCNVSRATVYRIQKEVWDDHHKKGQKKHAGGRPKKLSARDQRTIIRTLKHLRNGRR